MSRRLVCSIVLVGTASLWSAPAHADGELRFSVDRHTFFDAEPAWLVGVRPAVGWTPGGDAFSQLSLMVGKVHKRHVYLGGYVGARTNGETHLRAGMRSGVFVRGHRINVGTGTSLGVLVVPRSSEVGPIATWWAEARVRLSYRNFLTVYTEVDLLYRKLGFRQTRAVPSMGVGWTFLF